MNQKTVEGALAFMRVALKLKRIQRQGWLDRGVPAPESSADHSWSLALFAWLLAAQRDDLDVNRVMQLAVVHDLPEALAGDATPFDRHRADDGAIPEEHFRDPPVYDEAEQQSKHQREREALLQMTSTLEGKIASKLVALWDEYNAGTTAEARFVRQLDKLETHLQAETYRLEFPEIVIDSFRAGSRRDVDDPELQKTLAAILDLSDEESP